MKKIKLLLISMSGVCLSTLPLVATQCHNDGKTTKQDDKQTTDPINKETPNPATQSGTKDPQQGTESGNTNDKDKTTSVTINKDFLALDNDALVNKYIKHAPTLKDEVFEKKTAWVAQVEDLKDIEFNPSETEAVSVVSISMPDDKERLGHFDDWLKQGKMKVDYRFKVASKSDANVSKEFTTSYQLAGYISETKANEIFANSMNLLANENYVIDKSKLEIDIDSSREEFKNTNNSYKFIYGAYYPKSVNKAISIKNEGTLAKASYEYNKLAVNPAKNELRIEPFLYLDDKSINTFFAYRNGKQYIEDDQNTSIVFNNLPSRALSALAIATNYNLNQAIGFSKAKLEELVGKKLNEIDPKDVTIEMLAQALDINHTSVQSRLNNPYDKFDVTSDFVTKSNLHISELKVNEKEGSLYVTFEFNTIPSNDPNGTIYLGKGIEQSQDPNQFKTGTFVVKKAGFKAPKAVEESVYEEKAIFDLNPAMNFDAILTLWNAKKDKFLSKGGALQKYETKKEGPFLGITANSQNKSNKVLTLKADSGLSMENVLTTNPKGKNKFLDATLDETNKQLIVKYMLSGQPDKYYKQTIALG
ncbi:hypothetical protein [Mycoplasma sp. Z631]|uniref:hypothetical protein n=1 Tax=Mycoplasma sp. Z631 TaxID=3401685 RepID=UPI003AAADE84